MVDSWSGTSGFTMFDSETLEFWQKAIVLADVIYGHTRNFPADERFGLINQMRRSVVSLSSNIFPTIRMRRGSLTTILQGKDVMIRTPELGGFSSGSSDGCMNVTFAVSQATAATIGEDCGDFGHNRERDFFGRFAADVESGWPEQISDSGVEIVRSIFAEPRQQLGMTFSGP